MHQRIGFEAAWLAPRLRDPRARARREAAGRGEARRGRQEAPVERW